MIYKCRYNSILDLIEVYIDVPELEYKYVIEWFETEEQAKAWILENIGLIA